MASPGAVIERRGGTFIVCQIAGLGRPISGGAVCRGSAFVQSMDVGVATGS